MEEHYNQEYTQKEIDIILQKIKECAENNKYIILQNENRQENIQFIREYNLGDLSMKFFMSFAHNALYLMFLEKKKLLIFILSSILLNMEKINVLLQFHFIKRTSRLTTVFGS